MPDENVEIVRLGYERMNRGDIDGFLQLCAADFEFADLAQLPDSRVVVGHDAFRARWAELIDAFAELRFELEDVVDAGGDRVLVVNRAVGRGSGSGGDVEMPLFTVWTLRDGKLVGHVAYSEHAEALAAARLGAASEGNVEIVRRWIDAFNAGGIEEAMPFLNPDVEWTTTSAYLEAGTYRGHDGVRQYVRRATAEWDQVQLEPEGLFGAGEKVVVPLRVTARGRQSGASASLTVTVLTSLLRGSIVEIRNCATRAEALHAAGLEAGAGSRHPA